MDRSVHAAAAKHAAGLGSQARGVALRRAVLQKQGSRAKSLALRILKAVCALQVW